MSLDDRVTKLENQMDKAKAKLDVLEAFAEYQKWQMLFALLAKPQGN